MHVHMHIHLGQCTVSGTLTAQVASIREASTRINT